MSAIDVPSNLFAKHLLPHPESPSVTICIRAGLIAGIFPPEHFLSTCWLPTVEPHQLNEK